MFALAWLGVGELSQTKPSSFPVSRKKAVLLLANKVCGLDPNLVRLSALCLLITPSGLKALAKRTFSGLERSKPWLSAVPQKNIPHTTASVKEGKFTMSVKAARMKMLHMSV